MVGYVHTTIARIFKFDKKIAKVKGKNAVHKKYNKTAWKNFFLTFKKFKREQNVCTAQNR